MQQSRGRHRKSAYDVKLFIVSIITLVMVAISPTVSHAEVVKSHPSPDAQQEHYNQRQQILLMTRLAQHWEQERRIQEAKQKSLEKKRKEAAQAKKKEQARKQAQDRARKQAEQVQERRSSGYVLPVHGYRLTARYGACGALWSRCHTGLDFAAPTGTPVHAVTSGKIIESGWAGPYGLRVVQRLADGTILWYAHLSQISASGSVSTGSRIGSVGSTGNVTGSHLHLEVHPPGSDSPIDPYSWLIRHGVSP